VAWADVVVDNARPGSLDERYGPVRATEEHPSLVWCSITGFGQDGPYADWAGHDLTYLAHSGLMAGINPELPWHPQVVLAIPAGGLMAVAAVTAALFDRERTGRGAHLDISMSEATTWFLSGSDGHLTDSSYGIPISPAPPLPVQRRTMDHHRGRRAPHVDRVVHRARPRRSRGRGRPSVTTPMRHARASPPRSRLVPRPSGSPTSAPRRSDQHGARGLDLGRRPTGPRDTPSWRLRDSPCPRTRSASLARTRRGRRR
jgi:hypothetical protein